jgi:hypothetical protein
MTSQMAVIERPTQTESRDIRALRRHSRERGCQEILRTEKFVAPRKRRPKGKRLKSLASRFRGNDEKVA